MTKWRQFSKSAFITVTFLAVNWPWLLVANLQVDQQRRTQLPFHLLLLPLFPFLLFFFFFFFALSSHFRTLPLPDNRLSEERKKIKRNEEEANTKWSIVVREIVTSVLSSF